MAVIAGIARVTKAAVALTQPATTVESVNVMVSRTAEVLQAQEVLNEHLFQSICILQQQIDFLVKELALVRDMCLLE